MAVLRPLLQTRSLVSVFHLQAKPTIIPLQKRAFIPLTIKDVDVPTLTNKSLVPIKSLVTVVPSLEPSVKLSSIQNLEVNKKLLQSLTGPDSGYLDKCVQFILSQQIKVPEISLMVADKLSEVTYLTTKPYYNKEPFLEGLPKELKLGRYNPKDISLLIKNMNTLLKGVELLDEEDKALENIFSFSEEKYHKEKQNIIGLWLSQGMKDVRLPCDVAHRGRLLFCANRKDYTQEEDEIIMKFMENEGSHTDKPWAELSSKLGRTAQSLQNRYSRHLLHTDKLKKGRFSAAEDSGIMKALFMHEKSALNTAFGSSHEIWKTLGQKLNRTPFSVHNHWTQYIQPHLTMYNAGVHEIDFRFRLVDYCVQNKITYLRAADYDVMLR